VDELQSQREHSETGRAESERAHLGKLHEVGKKITEQLDDPDQVIRLVLEVSLELTRAQTGDLHLYEGSHLGTTYFTSREGERVLPAERIQGETAERVARGIIARVAETRQTYRTDGDAQHDPHYMATQDVHSEVAVPLVSGGELVGVLNLESRERRAFDSDDEWVLELLAGQAVIAIQKARAYRQAEEDKNRFRWLSRAGEELGEVTDISQLDRAYEVIVGIMGENNEGQAVIRRYEPETGRLVLKMLGCARAIQPFEEMPAEDVHWLRRHGQRTILYRDVHMIDGIAASISAPTFRSLVVTAVEFEDNYYGTLALSHEERDYFKEADVLLMEGLARQLAITINRVEEVQARKEAEQRASDAKMMGYIGSVAYEITHRLGNDLPLIRSRLDQLKDELTVRGISDERILKITGVMSDVTLRSLKMLRSFRENISKLGGGGLREEAPVDVPVSVLIDEAKQLLPAVSDNIEVRFGAEGGASVRVVPRQILDALYNLMTNAIEAMPDGGRLELRALSSGRHVKIEVADTGVGIPLERLDRIFELFYSTKNSSGFGLWSARLNVLANGGDLSAESRPGRGTTFVITLPRSA
jgi:signal transduction histidine kinase